MSSNRPVYRTTPRSHAWNCPCARCVQVRGPASKRGGGGPWLIWPLMIVIAGVIWVVKEPLQIWHTTGADGQIHPDAVTFTVYGIAGGIILVLLIAGMTVAMRKAPRAGDRL